ncbi:NLI interacting factor [Pelomyxa schiedti]|nr:NLI interacting factor [Pelomyxa schiedti]
MLSTAEIRHRNDDSDNDTETESPTPSSSNSRMNKLVFTTNHVSGHNSSTLFFTPPPPPTTTKHLRSQSRNSGKPHHRRRHSHKRPKNPGSGARTGHNGAHFLPRKRNPEPQDDIAPDIDLCCIGEDLLAYEGCCSGVEELDLVVVEEVVVQVEEVWEWRQKLGNRSTPVTEKGPLEPRRKRTRHLAFTSEVDRDSTPGTPQLLTEELPNEIEVTSTNDSEQCEPGSLILDPDSLADSSDPSSFDLNTPCDLEDPESTVQGTPESQPSICGASPEVESTIVLEGTTSTRVNGVDIVGTGVDLEAHMPKSNFSQTVHHFTDDESTGFSNLTMLHSSESDGASEVSEAYVTPPAEIEAPATPLGCDSCTVISGSECTPVNIPIVGTEIEPSESKYSHTYDAPVDDFTGKPVTEVDCEADTDSCVFYLDDNGTSECVCEGGCPVGDDSGFSPITPNLDDVTKDAIARSYVAPLEHVEDGTAECSASAYPDNNSLSALALATFTPRFDAFAFIKHLPPHSSLPPRPVILPPPATKRTTLALDLDETLAHCTMEPIPHADLSFDVPGCGHMYGNKRPHLEEFLVAVSALYELVVFTASQAEYATALLDGIDPRGIYFSHRIFREGCVLVEGNYVKDLTILGRDLSQVLIIDNNTHVFGYQVDNGIPIESFEGSNEDEELLKLIPLLTRLSSVEDVRPIIRHTFKTRQHVEEAL